MVLEVNTEKSNMLYHYNFKFKETEVTQRDSDTLGIDILIV